MSVYKTFPRANLIREWDKLIKLSKEEVVELYEQWQVIHKENEEMNKKMYQEKMDAVHEVSDFLKSKGIEVYKYKRSGFIPQKSGYLPWYKKNVVDKIEEKYPYYQRSIPTAHMGEYEVDGITLYNNQSPTNLVELYDKITRQYRTKINEVDKTDKLLIKSIEYATKNQIEINDLTPKQIIKTVEEVAKEKYLKKELPPGTEVYLKHECSECSSYSVGEHRCSCGNRRIYIEVEGNLIEGFYYYPQAY